MKNRGPELENKFLGGVETIPPEFLLAMERVETVQAVPNTVQPATGENVIASAVVTDRTNERVLRIVRKKNGDIVLVTISDDDNGVRVTITRTLRAEGGAVPTATATKSVRTTALGNGMELLEVFDLAKVFDQKTISKSRPDPRPEKFRVTLPDVETSEVVEGSTAQEPTLGPGDLAASEQRQTEHTVRKSRRTRAQGPTPVLTTKVAYIDRVKTGTVEESIVAEGTAVDSGLLVSESSVEPFGDGEALKRTGRVAEHKELKGARWDDAVGAHVEVREKFVAPAEADAPAAHTEYEIVNEDRSLRRQRVIPVDAYNNFKKAIYSRTNLRLPDTLLGIDVVWGTSEGTGQYDSDFEGFSSGTSVSLSGSENASASASASVVPELIVNTKQIWAENIPTMLYFFFLPDGDITAAQVLAKLEAIIGTAVAEWPVFKPESHTLVLTGMKASIQVQVNAQAHHSVNGSNESKSKTEGEGFSEDMSNVVESVRLPPMVHGVINVAGILTMEKTATVEAQVEWSSGGGFPPVFIHRPGSIKAEGAVSPGTLPATTPAAIPTTGLYLIDSRIQEPRDGFTPIMAEVLDASKLA